MNDSYDEQHWHLATADGMREPEDFDGAVIVATVESAAAADAAAH